MNEKYEPIYGNNRSMGSIDWKKQLKNSNYYWSFDDRRKKNVVKIMFCWSRSCVWLVLGTENSYKVPEAS